MNFGFFSHLMTEIEYLIIGSIFALLICIIYALVHKSNKRRPAVLTDKFCEKQRDIKRKTSETEIPNFYYLVFEMNKKKRRFIVSEFDYSTYSVGDKGVLNFKGEKFISFVLQ